MYKVIELGNSVPSTGEPRVRLLDSVMTKTASTEIQDFWDKIEKDDDSAYLWVIGVSAREYYGCNNNGDAFDEDELKRTHDDFVSNAHVFKHHVNKDPKKSIGKPVFSWYNEPMHRIELILKIDKTAQGASDVVEKLSRGEQLYVSMGCTVKYDQCSICGNKAPTRREYCDHLRYNMKKILKDGRQVYALNPDPKFFDISIVNKPADPTAFALDKMASAESEAPVEKLAADLGAEAELYQAKIAALDKVSDMIKHVSGTVADSKGEFGAAKKIREHGFDELEYPHIPHRTLTVLKVSPGGMMRLLKDMGAPMSFSDAMYCGGRHAFGPDFCDAHIPAIMAMLPKAISMLRESPEDMDGIIRTMHDDYDGEFDEEGHRDLVKKTLKPRITMRIQIFSKMAAEQPVFVEKSWMGATEAVMSQKGSNFAPIKLSDGSKTAPFFLRQNTVNSTPGKILGAALGVGALCAAVTAPSLAESLLYGTVLGLPASALLKDKPGKTERVSNGQEFDAPTLEQAWKTTPPKEKTAALRIGTVAGMAIPAALALDYSFNDWKYRNDPAMRMQYEQTAGGSLARAVAEYTRDNPITATLIGAGLGAGASGLLRKAILRRG